MGYYDVQVYDFNTSTWLTLNDGFYVSSSQPSNPSFSISPDGSEQGETLNVYISGDNGAQFYDYSGSYSDFRFNGYSTTFYGNTYGWDSGSDYISGSVSIPSWADVGFYDVQVYDYNTWSWLTLNDGFYVHQPSSPSFTISPDGGEQGETLNVYISGDNGAQFYDYSGNYSDFRFNGYSTTFYGNTYDWDSGSNYISGSVSIPSWADEGFYDVQVYDYNTWSWLTLNDGFYVHQPSSPSFTISPDGGEQGETLNVYISGDNGAQFYDYSVKLF